MPMNEYEQNGLLVRMFRAAWQYKVFVILVTLIVGGGVVGFAVLSLALPPDRSPMPNVYTAEALLVIRGPEEDQFSSLYSVASALGFSMYRNPAANPASHGETASRILRSRTILDTLVEEFAIVERYGITESVKTMSRQELRSRFSIDFEPESGFFSVSYTDTDPVFARDIVNRAVELLNEWYRTKGDLIKKQQSDLLQSKLAEVENDIARLENDITTFQKRYGVLTVEELANSQAVILADLRSQLINTEMEIRNHSQFVNIEDPALRMLRSEKTNLEEQIRQIEQGGDGAIGPARDEMPQLAMELQGLQTDLSIQRTLYESLARQYELVQLSLESGTIFQVIELAEVPDRKSAPNRSMMVVTATMAGFGLAVLLSLLFDSMRRIRNDPERLRQVDGLDASENRIRNEERG